MDETTPNAGEYHFEKMVSGMYMGEVARRIILRLAVRSKHRPQVQCHLPPRNAPAQDSTRPNANACGSSAGGETLAQLGERLWLSRGFCSSAGGCLKLFRNFQNCIEHVSNSPEN